MGDETTASTNPDRDLEPVVEAPIVSDRDTRPVCGAAISGLAFRVAGQVAERAGAPFDHIARVSAHMALALRSGSTAPQRKVVCVAVTTTKGNRLIL